MSEIVLVRYSVAAGREERNAALVRAVYEELGAAQPDGFHYATLREGASFMHLAVNEAGRSPLPDLAAFKAFQAGLRERCVAGPDFARPELVGSHRLLL
jgi:hypothetical protein